MILWTIQSLERWNALQANGILRNCLHFDQIMHEQGFEDRQQHAYEWMVDQMNLRLACPPSEEDLAPLWAWYQAYDSNKKRPDLRKYKKQTGVRIEFEIDDEKVLLSDYELWHFPLNYWYLPLSKTNEDSFDKELRGKGFNLHKQFPVSNKRIHQRIVRSWDRIFDLDWEDEYIAMPKDRKAIQATFWELHPSQVREVKPFGINRTLSQHR